ncbi:MAG: hypothetical protein LBU34_06795 [Planctomycetaceae bacterium]|jgi:hypothetical protein|nr:hypothetical protein [Planctomycetaceae bacterium]
MSLVNMIYDHSRMFLSFLSDKGLFWTIGNGFTVVLAFGMVLQGNNSYVIKKFR